MTDFEYRTFLLPQLLRSLGTFQGVRTSDEFLRNKFMEGDIAPDNATQVLSFIHQTAVLLNLAGYQLEAAALAAIDLDADGDGKIEGEADKGISSGIFINFVKGEYSTTTADPSDPENALEYLIQQDFLEDTDLCLALRITPRPMWWGASANQQFFSMPVPLANLGFSASALDTVRPMWLLLGGNSADTGAVVMLQDVTNGLNNSLTALNSAIADALAKEWATTVSLNNRKGLLKYLDPNNWGVFITEDAINCVKPDLSNFNQAIIDSAQDVFSWLLTQSEATFKAWLLSPETGTFKKTIKLAQAGHSLAEIQEGIRNVFIGIHPPREWVKYQHVWTLVDNLQNAGDYAHYVNILMMLDELSVIDMLAKTQQPPTYEATLLPFDIYGFYEQVIPPESGEDDPYTYDFHTIQLNQAGMYAQGHWQERQQPATCEDTYNGGRFVVFKHYRLCFDVLPGQDYSAGLDEIFMQVYRWVNPNFTTVSPYLKMPAETVAEWYCNKNSSEIGTVRITKTGKLAVDSLDFEASSVRFEPTEHGVELEFSIGDDTILLRRIAPLPYVAQTDLIQAQGIGRERLVIAQRFPLHSNDKVRILAATDYLVTGLGENIQAFSTLSYIDEDDPARDAITQIDHDFAEWMARYACVNVDSSNEPTSPQLNQIRTLMVQVLAQRKVLDDEQLDALTLLSVFLQRPIHNDLMPYTRKIFGSSLPKRTPEMEDAVNNNTAGYHAYRWGTNGLGEEGQSVGIEFLAGLGSKGVRTFSKILKAIVEFEKNVLPFIGLELSVFLLDIEKLTPFGTQYPGWAPGENHRYIGFQTGLSLSSPIFSGIYLEANSTQDMYASVNWDPGDFTGTIITFAASVGLVIDFTPLPFLRLDLNSFIENQLQNSTPVEMLCKWLEIDPQKIKLGTSLSATIFMGNIPELINDQELRVPIVSKGLNWVDYSYGLAYILEALAVTGAIFHIPEWINGSQATEVVVDEILAPIEPLIWRVIESQASIQTYNDIDEWQLEEQNKIAIREMVAEYLLTFTNCHSKLTIVGHASPIGSEPYNLWLSQKRAQAVYDYIRSLLADDQYLILPQNTIVQGYGELYANVYGAPERDESWQTVMVYLNGRLVLQIGESLSESDAG